jgi:hypothetical protein
MSGQEISEIDRKRINKKFFCSSCDLLLVEPMQTLCGHLICKGCVENIFRYVNIVDHPIALALLSSSVHRYITMENSWTNQWPILRLVS